MVTALDTFVTSPNTVLVLSDPPYTITIDETSFDLLTDTITVRGEGFSEERLGILHIEDTAGGHDDNGYFFVASFVSTNMMKMSFGGAGDAGLAASMLIHYVDSYGISSNDIAASNPSGTTITIP